jgi:hypothetical protein
LVIAPPLSSKLTEATPTGLEAPASSQESPVTVAPLEGIPTKVVGAWPMMTAPPEVLVPAAVQAPALGHETPSKLLMPAGVLSVAHVELATLVPMATPGPVAVAWPTAVHTDVVGHETPARPAEPLKTFNWSQPGPIVQVPLKRFV